MPLTHQHTLNPGEKSTREAVMGLENELMVMGGGIWVEGRDN